MNGFKKFYCFLVFFILSASAIYAETDFSVNLSGNLGYVPNSSMDDSIDIYGDAVAEQLNALNNTSLFEGKNDKAGFGYGADIEARMLMDSIGFGLSLGYQVGGESVSKAEADGYKSEQSLSLELTAVSYLATVYYKHAITESGYLLLGAGGGYYDGTMTLTEEAKGFASNNFKNDYEFAGSTWGGHLKMEYNYLIGSVDLFGGVMARYAKIDEFKKSGHPLTSDGDDNIEGSFSGVLFYLGAGYQF